MVITFWATSGSIIINRHKLYYNQGRPTPCYQEVVELADGDVGLTPHHLLGLVNKKNVRHVNRDTEAAVFVDHLLEGDGLPARPGRAHGFGGA